MISMIESLPVGNALRVHLSPPAGATEWRLLRSTASSIPSYDTPGAVLVHEGKNKVIVDAESLANGVTYYLRPFYFVAGSWQAADPRSAQPDSTFALVTDDYVELMRSRLQAGFASLVERGVFSPAAGLIPVLVSSPEIDASPFPLVTIHVASDSDGERGIGDFLADDAFVGDDLNEFDGWLARLQFTVIAWCQNSDERNAMRRQLEALLIANLPVFHAAGMAQVSVSVAHQEEFVAYPAPMYQAVATLTCLAPTLVGAAVPVVRDVIVDGVVL